MVFFATLAGILGPEAMKQCVETLGEAGVENLVVGAEQAFDQKIKEYEFGVEQQKLKREDIRDLVELTVGRMDVYHLVGALLLEFCIHFYIENKLLSEDPYSHDEKDIPHWILNLFLFSNIGAVGFLLFAVWLSMHASVAAHSVGVKMLVNDARITTPDPKALRKIRQSKGLLAQVKQRMAKGGSAFRHRMIGDGQAGDRTAESSSSHGPEPATPSFEAQAGADDAIKRAFDLVEHRVMFQAEQAKWLSYDAYARTCMAVGMNQMLQSLSYFIVGPVAQESPTGAVASLAAVQVVSLLLLQLDHKDKQSVKLCFGLSVRDPWVVLLLCPLPPLGAGCFVWLQKFLGEVRVNFHLAVTPCFILHGLWILYIRHVMTPDPVKMVPSRLRTVSYLDVFSEEVDLLEELFSARDELLNTVQRVLQEEREHHNFSSSALRSKRLEDHMCSLDQTRGNMKVVIDIAESRNNGPGTFVARPDGTAAGSISHENSRVTVSPENQRGLETEVLKHAREDVDRIFAFFQQWKEIPRIHAMIIAISELRKRPDHEVAIDTAISNEFMNDTRRDFEAQARNVDKRFGKSPLPREEQAVGDGAELQNMDPWRRLPDEQSYYTHVEVPYELADNADGAYWVRLSDLEILNERPTEAAMGEAEHRVDPRDPSLGEVTYEAMCKGLARRGFSDEMFITHWCNLKPAQARIASVSDFKREYEAWSSETKKAIQDYDDLAKRMEERSATVEAYRNKRSGASGALRNAVTDEVRRLKSEEETKVDKELPWSVVKSFTSAMCLVWLVGLIHHVSRVFVDIRHTRSFISMQRVDVSWPRPVGRFKVNSLFCSSSHILFGGEFSVYAAHSDSGLELGPLAEVAFARKAAMSCGDDGCHALSFVGSGVGWQLLPLTHPFGTGRAAEPVPLPPWQIVALDWMPCSPAGCQQAWVGGWDGAKTIVMGTLWRASPNNTWQFQERFSVAPDDSLCIGHQQACFDRKALSYDKVRALHVGAHGRTLVVLLEGGFMDTWDLDDGTSFRRSQVLDGKHTAICYDGDHVLLARPGRHGPVLESSRLPHDVSQQHDPAERAFEEQQVMPFELPTRLHRFLAPFVPRSLKLFV